MKGSELRPCEVCRGEIAPAFFTVRIETWMVDPVAVNQTMGLHQMLQGKAFGIAEAMSPDPEMAKPMGEPSRRLFVCMRCFAEQEALGLLMVAAEPKEESR